MKNLVFLFPGQGSQFVGMGQELCKEFSIARETFAEANEVLGFDLQKLCFEGDLDVLTQTENTQPAILTLSVASFRVFMQEVGLIPEYAIGHSLGEYSALVSAGALNFADAIKMVRLRGKFMQEAVALGEGSMMAVMKLNREIVDEVCNQTSNQDQVVVPANYNSGQQIVIAGHKDAVNRAGEEFESLGATVKLLQVSAPFHSPLMQPAADRMFDELKKYEFGKMNWPVISNVTAVPYSTTDNLRKNLTDQIIKPVRWHESIGYLANRGLFTAVELGPKMVLKNILKRSFPDIKVLNFESKKQLESIIDELPKMDLNKVIIKCFAVAVCTQNANWNNEEYQKGVVEPYKKLQQLQADIEKEDNLTTEDQAKSALEILKTILETKKVPLEEQKARFNEIFDLTGTRKIFHDFEEISSWEISRAV